MFTTQEETIKKIDEIQDNERLNKPNKETQGRKLSLDVYQEIFENKFKKVNDHPPENRKPLVF